MDVFSHEKQIQEYVKTIDRLKKQNFGGSLFNKEIRTLEAKLKKLKEQVYADLSPWERVQISRHSARPHAIDYITKMCDEFTELSGDRAFGEDRALIGGLARIGSMRCVIIGQEKGNDTESRLDRNFGMMRPEGYRKALRLMKLAEKFNLPIVSLVDTPGAFATLEAEQRGQAWVIAQNLREMAAIQVPIIVVIIGEGCSGGAIGIAVGDSIAMLEHAYYAVISPESCASILYKDPGKKNLAAAALKLNAEDIQKLEIIDCIIKEPHGGAHQDPQAALAAVKEHILDQWAELKTLSAENLLERRYHKFRRMGAFEYTS